MPQDSIEMIHWKKRRAAYKSAVLSMLMLLGSAAMMLFFRWYFHLDGVLGILMLVLSLIELGNLIPVYMILKARLKEIEGGEEDAAAQY